MEFVREEDDSSSRSSNLKRKIERLNEDIEKLKLENASGKKQKSFKMPWKWKTAVNKSFKKNNDDNILCWYLTAKGQWVGPMFVPLVGGNVLIVKNRAHEFIPSEMTWMKVGTKTCPIYVLRQIDRKPISNTDWNEVINRKDTTKDDEVILKMLKLAMIEKVKGAINKNILWIVGIGIAAVVIGYMIFGK